MMNCHFAKEIHGALYCIVSNRSVLQCNINVGHLISTSFFDFLQSVFLQIPLQQSGTYMGVRHYPFTSAARGDKLHEIT